MHVGPTFTGITGLVVPAGLLMLFGKEIAESQFSDQRKMKPALQAPRIWEPEPEPQ